MTDRVQRTKVIAFLFTCYGKAHESEQMVAYVQMLSDIPLDVLNSVCRKSVGTHKFLPGIAEIIEDCRTLLAESSGNRVKTWAEAQKEIQRGITMTWFHGCLGEDVPDELYGKPCEPKWSTPEIKAAVDSYGLDNIGRAMESDMPIVWAQLRKAYEQACERKRDVEVNKFVLGGGNELKLITDKVTKKIGGM